MSDVRFWKGMVVLNGLVPLAILAWDATQGGLGANGVNFAIHTTGILALLFLILSLAVTPVRLLTGWNEVIAYRRALGLFGFFYACVHVAIYVVLDRALNFSSTLHEILTRRFLQIGFLAVLLMVPLAVTSTNRMLAWLGAKNWKRLHRLAYLVAALGALHYILSVKAITLQPLAFAAVVGVLLAVRVAWKLVAPAKLPPLKASLPAASKNHWTGELQVVSTRDETPEVRTFRLAAVPGGALPFEYLPGQYLSLQVLIDGKRVNRSYTIASSPTAADYCELSIKREAQGLVSAHLHRQLQGGVRLQVKAPLGKFVFTGEFRGAEAEAVVLIAGGVGITPLMSIARYLTDTEWPGKIYFFFVVKTAADIIFHQELQDLQRRFPNFKLCISLTQAEPSSDWEGNLGRLTAGWLSETVPHLTSLPIYICGPNPMMDHAREVLAELQVPASNIHLEAFSSAGATSKQPKSSAVTASQATVTFAKSVQTCQVDSSTNLLEASEACGVNLPFECRSGICGQCRVRLLSGSVQMNNSEALSSADQQAGWILACQSHCTGDVALDA